MKNLPIAKRDPCCADETCGAEPIVHTPVDDCCAAKADEIAALVLPPVRTEPTPAGSAETRV